MKREIGGPVMIGVVLVVLVLVGFFFWRSYFPSEPHEVPAPAKDPDTNPMFKSMRESMKSSNPQNANPGGVR